MAADFISLATITVTSGSGQTSIDFNSIPSTTYTHLQLRATAREATSTNFVTPALRFNGDTGSNYAWSMFMATSSNFTTPGKSSSAATNIRLFEMTGNSAANTFASCIIDILDYRNTNKTKCIRSQIGFVNNTDSVSRISATYGMWNNTSAITSINISGEIANIAQGSTWALYGIRTA